MRYFHSPKFTLALWLAGEQCREELEREFWGQVQEVRAEQCSRNLTIDDVRAAVRFTRQQASIIPPPCP